MATPLVTGYHTCAYCHGSGALGTATGWKKSTLPLRQHGGSSCGQQENHQRPRIGRATLHSLSLLHITQHHAGCPAPARSAELLSRCSFKGQFTYVHFSQSAGIPQADNHPEIPPGPGFQLQSPQHLADLDEAVDRCSGSCVAPTTRSSYATAYRRYTAFFHQFSISSPFPLAEGTLCHFTPHSRKSEAQNHQQVRKYSKIWVTHLLVLCHT